MNVLALVTAPPIPQLAAAGVRRVSTGSLPAGAAYGALHAAAQELLDAGPRTMQLATSRAPCYGMPLPPTEWPEDEKCIQSLTPDQSPPQPQPMALNAATTPGVTIPLRGARASM